MTRRTTMLDRACNLDADCTHRPAADQLRPSAQAASAVSSGGLTAAKVALSGVAWCLALAWLDYGQGIGVRPSLALVLGFVVMIFTLFLMTMPTQSDD
jgi:hypothetical protein